MSNKLENELEAELQADGGLDLDLLLRFCSKFDVRFVSEGVTHENGYRENIYFFSDELGGYTVQGIRNSLKDD